MSVTKPLLLNETGEAIVEALQDLAGGKKIQQIIDTAGLSHNGIYRGKFLGVFASVADVEAFLSEHNITSGKFTDLYLGDYVIIQDGTYNKEWEIVGFDHYLHKGDTDFTIHHVVFMPRVNLLNIGMNATDTTEGGYAGSRMNTETLPTIVTNLQTVLNNHLLSRRVLLTNTVSTTEASMAGSGLVGTTTNWVWASAYAVLPSEVEIYGSTVWSSSARDVGEANERLPLFTLKGINYTRQYYWLRAVTSTTLFANVSSYGFAICRSASHSAVGVRPLICLG